MKSSEEYQSWWLGGAHSDVQTFLKEEFAEIERTTKTVIWIATGLFFLRGFLEVFSHVDLKTEFAYRIAGFIWLAALCWCYGHSNFVKFKASVFFLYILSFCTMISWLATQHQIHVAYVAVPLVLSMAFGILMWPTIKGVYWPVLGVLMPSMVMLYVMEAAPKDFAAYIFYFFVGVCFAIAVRRTRMKTAFTLFVFRENLRNQATKDPLTNLLNRAGWRTNAQNMYEKHMVMGQPVVVAFVDIDHFKKVNDQYGHAMGDKVLIQTAQTISKCLDKGALLARVGGEEFVAAMPNMNLEQAKQLAETIRKSVEDNKNPVPITVSIGLSQTRQDVDLTQAMHEADMLLYRAKEQGRNRICEGNLDLK